MGDWKYWVTPIVFVLAVGTFNTFLLALGAPDWAVVMSWVVLVFGAVGVIWHRYLH